MPVVINGTTGVSGVDGSAGTPAYQGTDTNTGITFPAADTIAFVTAGTEDMRIDSAGNVGIGTSSPGTFANRILAINGTDSGIQFQVSGSGTSRIYTSAGEMRLQTQTAIPLTLYTNNIERARIDSTGNFSITQPAGSYTVDVTGGATSIANNGTVDFANASGMLVVNSANTGGVSIYLCGGGTATAVSSVIGQVGTMSYVAGIAGYRWTNNSGSTGVFGFFFVRTRVTA